MSIFRTTKGDEVPPQSPQELFGTLKRDPSIKFLWTHQDKILQRYLEARDKSTNLALELPTGSGKTLVGMLIAEYCRRTNDARVAYLCPTRQLARQVASHAAKYGVKVSLLIGAQRFYDEVAFTRYQRGASVAVTTYSGLFNTNPRIDDPDVLICDDAHAAENFVPEMWTISVSRKQHQALFLQLLAHFRPVLSYATSSALERDLEYPTPILEFVSPISLAQSGVIENVRSCIDEVLHQYGSTDEYRSLAFQWRMVRPILESCPFYVSDSLIQCRPMCALTMSHAPFRAARHRVFMSATLGEDGDLERCFGIERIDRIESPPDVSGRSLGRRLILFPRISAAEADEIPLSSSDFGQRLLLLAPSDRQLEEAATFLPSGMTILTSDVLEEDLAVFSQSSKATALLLANRYDGIDFPGDTCRATALFGTPVGATLQERFLWERLLAFPLLRDRLRTRLLQGIGRCVRDEADYCVVFVLGAALLKWFCTRENTSALTLDLQAEVEFGLRECEGRTAKELSLICKSFMARDDDWLGAESSITKRIRTIVRERDRFADTLADAAQHEVQFSYFCAEHNYHSAVEAAERAIQALGGGDELRGLRALWYHNEALAAFLHHLASNDMAYLEIARKAMKTAAELSRAQSFRSCALLLNRDETLASAPSVSENWLAILDREIEAVGVRGNRCDRQLAKLRSALTGRSTKSYHDALSELGSLLGATAQTFAADSAPDGLWLFDGLFAFVFEVKVSEQVVDGDIGTTTLRQALTHEQYVRNESLVSPDIPIRTVLITFRRSVDPVAQGLAEGVAVCHPDEIVQLFDDTVRAFVELRRQYAGMGDLALEAAPKIYGSENLLPPFLWENKFATMIGDL